MRRKLSRAFGIAYTSVFVAFFVLANINTVQAASATLVLSPSKGSFAVGANFNVNVVVNSGGGAGINAAESTISYNTDVLSVNTVSQSGSIFELWTTKPAYSNKTGKITFGGGLTDTFTGAAGKVISISFKAVKAGEGKVTFGSSVVTARDGLGTNIFSGGSTGTYTITEKAEPKPEAPKPDAPKPTDTKPAETAPAVSGVLPPAPEVTSPTHPNANEWYATSKVQLDWRLLPSIIGVSSVLTESPSSTPGNTSDGIVQTKTIDKLADGIHYFHLKLQNKTGWGPISRRQILVDSEAPSTPRLIIENGGDATNPNNLLKVFSEDKTSGISKYKINLNNTDKEVQPRDLMAEPYQLDKLLPGRYTISVTAYDKANNTATSSITFLVDALKSPTITDMPKEIKSGTGLTVRGASFYPGAMVNIFISLNGADPVKGEAKTDENGDWNYFHNGKLAVGNYEVWAKIIDSRGAESGNSTKLVLSVVKPDIVALYGLYIILILIFIIVVLCLYIWMLKKNFRQEKADILVETHDAQKRINEIFVALHEEVDELIVYADKKPGLSESERRIKEKISEALDISEEFLSKEVEDIERGVAVPAKKKK